jgi:hypothetical protein
MYIRDNCPSKVSSSLPSLISSISAIYKADYFRILYVPSHSETNIFKVVFNWLCDKDHGLWLLILDNANDMETFSSPMSNASLVKGRLLTPLVKFPNYGYKQVKEQESLRKRRHTVFKNAHKLRRDFERDNKSLLVSSHSWTS